MRKGRWEGGWEDAAPKESEHVAFSSPNSSLRLKRATPLVTRFVRVPPRAMSDVSDRRHTTTAEGGAGRGRRRGKGRLDAAPPRTGDKLQAAIDAPLEDSYRAGEPEPRQREKKTERRRRRRGGRKHRKRQEAQHEGDRQKAPDRRGAPDRQGASDGRGAPDRRAAPKRREGEGGGRRRRRSRERTDDARSGRERVREGARHICPLCMRSAPRDKDTLRGLLDHLLEDHGLTEAAVPAVLNMHQGRQP